WLSLPQPASAPPGLSLKAQLSPSLVAQPAQPGPSPAPSPRPACACAARPQPCLQPLPSLLSLPVPWAQLSVLPQSQPTASKLGSAPSLSSGQPRPPAKAPVQPACPPQPQLKPGLQPAHQPGWLSPPKVPALRPSLAQPAQLAPALKSAALGSALLSLAQPAQCLLSLGQPCVTGPSPSASPAWPALHQPGPSPAWAGLPQPAPPPAPSHRLPLSRARAWLCLSPLSPWGSARPACASAQPGLSLSAPALPAPCQPRPQPARVQPAPAPACARPSLPPAWAQLSLGACLSPQPGAPPASVPASACSSAQPASARPCPGPAPPQPRLSQSQPPPARQTACLRLLSLPQLASASACPPQLTSSASAPAKLLSLPAWLSLACPASSSPSLPAPQSLVQF
ncbi:uncharacterized protein LOC134204880, partial [Armigeres subalbatus]|uniref:uncharacterized protein LOC134204880 n=1 Tax=Armigeres subalbatus TaxID=124917 RepID=UPI002ED16BE2